MKEQQQEDKCYTNWSRAYWISAVNQLVVIAILAVSASQFVSTSRDACEKLDLTLPDVTRIYLTSLGPSGVLGLSGLGAIVIVAMALIRKRFVSVLLSSLVFVAIVSFLVYGIVCSYLPLWDLVGATQELHELHPEIFGPS